MGITVVRQYERLAKFRLGAFKGVVGPGSHWLWPLIDVGHIIDLRETVVRVTNEFSTSDVRIVDVNYSIGYQVIQEEAEKAILEVHDYNSSVLVEAIGTMKEIVGGISEVSSLAEIEQIGSTLQTSLNRKTRRFGVKINKVEVESVTPRG